jgi:predicted short-subunit dehydrogenase-like oxidoreductase (DUF2520 family)
VTRGGDGGEKVIIVGPGRLGLALGGALVRSGEVGSVAFWGRRPDPPDHPMFDAGLATYRYGVDAPAPGTTVVILAVPDRELMEIAGVLAARGAPAPGTPVLHCAGALGADPLEALHARGYAVGTLHPLQTIANPVSGADRLYGAAFAISGEPGALAAARRLVAALDGRALTVPTARRPLYHAAAVMASNHVVVLLRTAVALLEEAGATPEEAEYAMVSLARGALENAGSLGLDRALTGPVFRGDAEVVGLHMRTLSAADGELYAALARRALDMARPGLSEEVAAALDAQLRNR